MGNKIVMSGEVNGAVFGAPSLVFWSSFESKKAMNLEKLERAT